MPLPHNAGAAKISPVAKLRKIVFLPVVVVLLTLITPLATAYNLAGKKSLS